MTTATSIPVEIQDPINARILSVSEDKIQGFLPDPFGEISRQSGVDLPTVVERIAAMVRRRNNPTRSPDADGNQPCKGSPDRLAGT